MGKYEIDKAVNGYVIVEPYEKSSVLQTDETSTVFKVLKFSIGGEFEHRMADQKNEVELWRTSALMINEGNLVIVTQGSVEKTIMGGEEVFYLRPMDIIATVKDA